MVDRRGFLKGLAAFGSAPLVPSPVLWTPEQRQIVATTEMPPQVDAEFVRAANISDGFLAVVVPPRSRNEGWTAMVGEPISLSVVHEQDAISTAGRLDGLLSSIPGPTSVRVEAEMWPGVSYASDVSPQRAIADAWKDHKASQNRGGSR